MFQITFDDNFTAGGKPVLTKPAIEGATKAIRRAQSVLRTMHDFGELLLLLIEDYDKRGADLQNRAITVDAAKTVAAIKKRWPQLGEALERAEITRFELGRLEFRPRDLNDDQILRNHKYWLKEFLQKQHRTKVLIRIGGALKYEE